MGMANNQNKKRAGSAGGKVGGVNRAKKLTSMQKSNIASQGGKAKQQRQSLPNRKSK